MISGWTGGPNTSTLSLFQAGDLLTDAGAPAALWGPLGMPPTLPNAVQGASKHQKNSQRNCSEVECSHLIFFFFFKSFSSHLGGLSAPGAAAGPQGVAAPAGSNQDLSLPAGARSPGFGKWHLALGRGQGPRPARCCFSDRQAANSAVHVKRGDSAAGVRARGSRQRRRRPEGMNEPAVLCPR